MRSRMIRVILSCVLLCSLLITAAHAAAAPRIIINGTPLNGVFISDSTMFAPVRRVFEGCGYAVGWDSANGCAIVALEDNTVILAPQDGCRNVNGTLFAPVRRIAEILGAQVSWDEAASAAYLEISGIEMADAALAFDTGFPAYTEDDLYWLARIIYAEAQGESMEGKIAVGNVILERVRSPQFPDTICGVIFDRLWGVQFEPVINGRIYNTPDESCIEAARRALEGECVVVNCLYFLNPVKATNRWIINNRGFYMTIGNHDFYV